MTQEEKQRLARYAAEEGAAYLTRRGLPLTDQNVCIMTGFVLGVLYTDNVYNRKDDEQ